MYEAHIHMSTRLTIIDRKFNKSSKRIKNLLTALRIQQKWIFLSFFYRGMIKIRIFSFCSF